jgi:formylglycine-generating enzyme required for sulfatase activity
MTPDDSILQLVVDALAAGAAALQPRAHAEVRKAYAALTSYLAQHYPEVEISALEKKPEARHRRDAVRQDFPAAAQTDALLFAHAAHLAETVGRRAQASAEVVAVDLKRVRAGLIRLRAIQSSGKAVVIEDGEAQQVVIDEVQAGEGEAALRAEFTGNARIGKLEVNVERSKGNDPALLQRYLHWVLRTFDRLKLEGIDLELAKNEQASRLRLSAVYTALLTRSRERAVGALGEEGRTAPPLPRSQVTAQESQLSALEQLDQEKHLVLLGDSGSGKSSLVDFVALCMAGELVSPKNSEVNLKVLRAPLPPEPAPDAEEERKKKGRKLQTWRHGALLPVRVILRDLVAWAGFPPSGSEATAEHLWGFLAAELRKAQLEECSQPLHDHLKEHGGLILLDGLDEAPEANQRRSQIVQAIERFCASFARCRVLVTSRPYAYSERAWQLPGFAVALLDDFSQGQMADFIERWYDQRSLLLGDDPALGAHRAQLLRTAIFQNERLFELAKRPLLLTLTAGIHAWRQGALPEGRADLYEQAVELLLVRWEERLVNSPSREVAQQSLSALLGLERSELRPVLQQLAFAAQRDQQGLSGSADIPIAHLLLAFNRLLRQKQKHELSESRLISYLEQRSGLLIGRANDCYALPHRTFQEYLAACFLAQDDYPYQLATLARRDPERWREVTLLCAARAAIPYAIWGLAEKLWTPATAGETALAAQWGALLAGQAVEESMPSDVRQREVGKLAELRRRLVAVLEESELPAGERALAGRTLAKLGDPRSNVMSVAGMEFCFVPPGGFYRSADDRPATLDYPFWMGRWPLTQAQFAEFRQAGGYANKGYWAEAIKTGAWKAGAVRNWMTGDFQDAPHAFGEPFDLPNHPVVGVTWYEAIAFCRWLAEWLHLPGWTVRLPTELEWEKAARGGVETPREWLRMTVGQLDSEAGGQVESTTGWMVENRWPRRKYSWG